MNLLKTTILLLLYFLWLSYLLFGGVCIQLKVTAFRIKLKIAQIVSTNWGSFMGEVRLFVLKAKKEVGKKKNK